MEVTLSSTAAEACVLNRVVCCLEALSSTLVFLFVCLFLCGFLVAFIFFRGGGGSCGVVLNISVGFDKSNLKVNVHFIVHVQTGWLTVLFVSQRVQHL